MKTFLSIVTIIIITLFSSYLIIPNLKNVEGLCFYFPSEDGMEDILKGEFDYIKVHSKDIIRYKVEYYKVKFNPKDFIISENKKIADGYLGYLFYQTNYLNLKCPSGEYFSFK